MPRRVLGALLAVDVLLTGAYAAAIVLGYSVKPSFAFVDLNSEANPAAWWSSAKLLVAGLMLIVLASRFFADDERVRAVRPLLLTLGLGLVFLSADEAGTIHERLSHICLRLGFDVNFAGGGYWMLPYALVAMLGAVVLAPRIIRFTRQWPTRVALFLSGILMAVGGGVVIELISYVWARGRYQHLAAIGVEELLEMMGFSLVTFAISLVFFEAVAQVAARLELVKAPDAEPEHLSGKAADAG